MHSIDCNNCKFINMTEDEQNLLENGKKINHKCIIFNRLLFHRYKHPSIKPCQKCSGKHFIPRYRKGKRS